MGRGPLVTTLAVAITKNHPNGSTVKDKDYFMYLQIIHCIHLKHNTLK